MIFHEHLGLHESDASMEQRLAEALHGIEELPELLQRFTESQHVQHRELCASLDSMERRLEQIMRLRAAGDVQEIGQEPHESRSPSKIIPFDDLRESPNTDDSRLVTMLDEEQLKQADLRSLHLAQNWEAHGINDSAVSSLSHDSKQQGPLVLSFGGTSVALDIISAIMVIMNAVTMVTELEWRGATVAGDLNIAPPTVFTQQTQTVFNILEKGFCVIFLLEIIVRICAKGMRFFRNVWNIVDTIVVLTSIAEEFLLQSLGVGLMDVKLLRAFRLTRLAKAARVMRIIKFVDPLRVLLVCIASSVGSLFWAMVLVTVIQSIAAVAITQIVHEFVIDENQDLKLRQEVFHWFGRWSTSMLTMLELTLAPGAWAKPARLLIFEVHPLYAMFFIPYVWGVSFAIIRVISAMFVQQTMCATSKDEDLIFQAALQKHTREVKQIRAIFETVDQSGRGRLCINDFDDLFHNPRTKMWIKDLGLETNEVSGLFRLMDDGDGKITFEEFLSGLLRLRGGAKSVDLATLLYENRRVIAKVEALRKDVALIRDGRCHDAPQNKRSVLGI